MFGGVGGTSTTEGAGGGGSGFAHPTLTSSRTFTQGGNGTSVPSSSLLPTGGTGTYASGGGNGGSAASAQGKQGCVVIDNDNGSIT